MSKGERTREVILERGIALAYRRGLEGLTVGTLATEVGMSKSGMYAHFGSRQALQVAVLDAAARDFVDAVIRPALAEPRGEPRIRALVDGWLTCGKTKRPGGCLFVKAGTELGEQPGPARDLLRDQHRELAMTIDRMVSGGVVEGQFRPDVDPQQFATDLHGVMLAFYYGHRLLELPGAEVRARVAVEALLDAARPRTAARADCVSEEGE